MDLVVGIGNRLRGDDGIGPVLADAVPPRTGLETMSVHQLVPELAEQLTQVDRVLFVDAELRIQETSLRTIEPQQHSGLGHACSPQSLLHWTAFAFGRAPAAWLLSVPASRFDHEEALSAEIASRIPVAKQLIEAWLDERGAPDAMTSEEEA